MKRLMTLIEQFFFARRAAWPFGLMRIGWGSVVLAFILMQFPDVTAFYSDSGYIPRDFLPLITRADWYLSIAAASGEMLYVQMLYGLLVLSLVCTILGIFPRTSTIVSYVLLAGFHERNMYVLGGGDTLLRSIGFILMIAPGIDTLSLAHLRKQYQQWRTHRSLLVVQSMPAWPYRLLLWQMLVLYASSLWWKLLGTMWLDGTAVGAALHHPVFIRWPYSVMNLLMPVAPFITWGTLAFEALWLLLLIPERWLRISLKRWLLLVGVVFHGSIAFFMDVGSFSFAVLTAYLGLIDQRDRAWFKRIVDQRSTHPLTVLYDGRCRLCRRSAFVLAILDTFKHLKLVDFRDDAARNQAAPHLSESQLDLALHMLLPDGGVRTGYDAFRFMSWHLPALWLFAPFLYLPGISHVGRRIYAWTAKNRQKCTHDRC